MKIICITGLDGTGKSTLVNHLARHLPGSEIVTIWDGLRSEKGSLPLKSKRDMDRYLCGLTTNARWLFLAHAMKSAMDQALFSGKKTILIDGYYYKYLVSEMVYGVDEKLVDGIVHVYPTPDVTLAVNLDLELIVERKQQFSGYESGLVDHPDKETFIAHQRKVHQKWHLLDKKGWYILDGRNSEEKLVDQTLEWV